MSSSQVCSSLLLLSHLLFYLLHTTAFVAKPAFGFTNETDRQALLAFKDRVTDDPSSIFDSWNDSTHFCYWQGVTCGLKHQRVTLLNLSSLNLAGSLSPQIGNLTFLEEINLHDNFFQGTIPQELGRLFRLQYLRLANNSFVGKTPVNLTRCLDIRIVDLRGNKLGGRIPPEFGTLSELYALSLSRNRLSGTIPPSLGNLSALQILSLSRNGLFGGIPVELGKLANLTTFELSSNKLSGIIDPQLYNISSIRTFSVTNNSLTGSFPPDLGLTFPKLQLFLADLNQFSGSLPASLANASGLVKISMGDNNVTGPIPRTFGRLQNLQVLHIAGNPLGLDKSNDISFISSLTNCSNLRTLSLSRMQIGGEVPNSIGNLSSKLDFAWLDQNYISGTIPEEISNLVGLTYLTIDTNLLTGKIPDTVGRLSNLQELYLFTNKLTREIPSAFGNITGLSALVLEENMLEGIIPASLGNCSNLQGLHLARNRLTGGIPEEIVSLSSLYLGLILAQNFLTGPLPPQVGKLVNLASLDISENEISGKIPTTLGNCLMLDSLQMEDNFFEGTIPSELKNLKSIEVMDLSRNNLSGQIPQFLGDLKVLEFLNLSFNKFEGEVPKGRVFENTSLFSVLGNTNLCGGVNQLGLSPCPPARKKSSLRASVLLATGISLFVVLSVLCVLVFLYRKKRKSKESPPLATTKETQYPKLSYLELAQSTGGFSSSNLIGKGKYGYVYKGILNPGSQTIAVKVLNLEESGADKSFFAECEALRNLRHRNLVKVITTCSSIDSKGDDFKALVFEFMPNGSLERWLYPGSNQEGEEERENLSLKQRLDIAIDVASALDYLHHHYGVPIIHCDLKPSNVLLDHEFCARVSDFGLARFLLATSGESDQAQSSSIGIRGTIGYIAPEYGMGGDISTQGDLYSYGILLLEMFTGKRPTSNMFTDSFSLRSYVEMALPHRVMKVIDPKIVMEEKEEDEEEEGGSSSGKITSQMNKGNGLEECLASILQIGVSCSAESPRDRMDTKGVLQKLHRIKNDIAKM